jgi:DNA (cytosine-5)-methyltransferase 1
MGNLKFIDFCAGIGGGRIGLENLGMECVGFSEIDRFSIRTYKEIFNQEEKNYGNLMKINPADLPEFDLMIAGFPCQPFSVVGPRTGMKDGRGLIIFGLIDIMRARNIKYFILENVKGLSNHDGGESLRVILKELEGAGYKVFWRLMNSLHYGVPQLRERLYFVGIRKDLVKKNTQFNFQREVETPSLNNYLIDTNGTLFDEKLKTYNTFLKYLNNKYNKGKFDINNLLKEEYLVLDTRQSDLRLYRNKVPTLRVGRHGILYVKEGKLRKLSGHESLLLQGFPEKVALKIKNTTEESRLLSQAGNAMTVNVVELCGKSLINYLNIKNG